MATATEQVVGEAHRRAVSAPVSEVAGLLQNLLSRRLTAYVAGVGEGKTVARWASGEITDIRDHTTEQRLRTAYEVAHILIGYDLECMVKGWFIGLDPQLGDVSPAEAIHEGRLKESVAAARAFATGG